MTFKTTFFSAITTTGILMLLFSCEQNSSNENIAQASNIKANSLASTIDTFSTFPPEIDGCSCYFSSDSVEFKKGNYIYMDDNSRISFLKINGVIIKFTQTSVKEIDKKTTVYKAKSDNYELTVEVINGIQNGDETWLKTGTIKVKNRNGLITTKSFYGDCGC